MEVAYRQEHEVEHDDHQVVDVQAEAPGPLASAHLSRVWFVVILLILSGAQATTIATKRGCGRGTTDDKHLPF